MNNTVSTARTSKPQVKAAPTVLGRKKEDALQDPLKTGGLTDSLVPTAVAPVAAAESGASLAQPRQSAGVGDLVGTAAGVLTGPGTGVGTAAPSAGLAAPAAVVPPAASAQPAQAASVAPVAVVVPEAARAAGGGKPETRRAAKGAKASVAAVPVKVPVATEVVAKGR